MLTSIVGSLRVSSTGGPILMCKRFGVLCNTSKHLPKVLAITGSQRLRRYQVTGHISKWTCDRFHTLRLWTDNPWCDCVNSQHLKTVCWTPSIETQLRHTQLPLCTLSGQPIEPHARCGPILSHRLAQKSTQRSLIHPLLKLRRIRSYESYAASQYQFSLGFRGQQHWIQEY